MKELSPKERRAIGVVTHIDYRPDIDGLRALAVLPVVFNHAGVPGVWGGYVGVDIFFVISGYLITGILVRDLAIGQHSIAEFYRRRILRIFPALFVMLAVVTAVSCITMLPGELSRYARSLGATTLFGSNILFFSETGYFEPAAHIKPLLHTWSLAIEEQFYIIWPLMLATIGVASPQRLKAVVLGVTLVSFAVAVWMVATNASAAFYLLPARAWELSLGAMLALWRNPIRRRWVGEVLAVIGLLMILYAVRRYTEATPFPGAAALLPCLGAALMILTGNANTLVSRIFSLPPILFVGRISYSLYLWHWPVIVFAEIGLFLPKTPLVMAGEITMALVLATLSWAYIERPFRVGVRHWRTSRVLLAGLAVMAVSLVGASLLWTSGGFGSRFTPAQRAVAAYEDMNGDALYRGGSCFAVGDGQRYDAASCLRAEPDKPVLLLVGDSHAAHLWPGLSHYLDRFAILQATRTGCKPLLYPAGQGGECENFFRSMLGQWVSAHPPSVLLLAARWRPDDLPLLEATLADSRIRAANPVLIGPVPQYTTALPRLLVFANSRGDPQLPGRSQDEQTIATDRAMRQLAARKGARYISLVDLLCPGGGPCRTWALPGVPLQFDYGHFTREGSAVTVHAIMPEVTAAVGR